MQHLGRYLLVLDLCALLEEMDNAVRDALNYKVVVLGDKNVGKTSLVCRYIEDTFRENNASTIGAFFLQKKEHLPDNEGLMAKLQVWDTAGQERYRAIASLYYRNADAAIVCYDFSDEQSFIQMKDWINELKQNLEDGTYVLIIASTKIDKGEQYRGITLSRCQEYAKDVNAFFFETSAKSSIGVTDLFQTIVKEVSTSIIIIYIERENALKIMLQLEQTLTIWNNHVSNLSHLRSPIQPHYIIINKVYAMRCRDGITAEVPTIRDSEIIQLTARSLPDDKEKSSSSCSGYCS